MNEFSSWRRAACKRAIVALVERGGSVRTFHVANADADTVVKIVHENVDRETRLHTDESHLYKWIGSRMSAHETAKHSAREYVRGDIHRNTVEGYFLIFKRGMCGIQARANRAIRGAGGKRLRHQGTH